MKNKMPFGKNAHVQIIKSIALGLNAAGALNNYLELGIRRGRCFNAIAPLVRGKAYAVDINDCYPVIKNNKNLIWFHGTSEKFLNDHKKDEKFDLVFIDANHTYNSSLKDFDLVFPLVNDNGLILLHDTYPPEEKYVSLKYCGEVYKTAEFIRFHCNDKCEIVTLPFYYGIAVVRKLDRQLLWKKAII